MTEGICLCGGTIKPKREKTQEAIIGFGKLTYDGTVLICESCGKSYDKENILIEEIELSDASFDDEEEVQSADGRISRR